MSGMRIFQLDHAEKIQEHAQWECGEHDEFSQEHIEKCLNKMLSAYVDDDRNYVVDYAEIECSDSCSYKHCIRYKNGKTRLYDLIKEDGGGSVERNYIPAGKQEGEIYYFGDGEELMKMQKLHALHAIEASANGIRFATVADNICLRDVEEGIKKIDMPEDGLPITCKANIVSMGNCRIMRESDIPEIEKRLEESIKYGTCYSLIKPAGEWVNPICTEDVTGKCYEEDVGDEDIIRSSCTTPWHHKVMKFDTKYGQKEGLTMLSTLLCTRGGVITIKVHGQIYLDFYEGDLVYETVTGATLITDSMINPQGIPLYSGKTMNGKYEYCELTPYTAAKYPYVSITVDKTRLEGRSYRNIHPAKESKNLPLSFNEDYHGTFTSRGNTFSLADNRIEVAVRWGISTCDGEPADETLAGKYLDIELSDGTVLACIMGGAKGDENSWDTTGVVHQKDSIIELLETGDLEINADKWDILHGCDMVGVYVYSEKRLYDKNADEYTYYFSDGIDK